jgi:CRISPR/Cas system-associated endonuclease/helicase Cas3
MMTEHATEVEEDTDSLSGEAYLKVEEEQPEVVELPPNIQRLQEKQARLQQEVAVYQAQINEIADKLETAQLAFQQCVVLLQVEQAQSE